MVLFCFLRFLIIFQDETAIIVIRSLGLDLLVSLTDIKDIDIQYTVERIFNHLKEGNKTGSCVLSPGSLILFLFQKLFTLKKSLWSLMILNSIERHENCSWAPTSHDCTSSSFKIRVPLKPLHVPFWTPPFLWWKDVDTCHIKEEIDSLNQIQQIVMRW
jgi:hypothetical protein